MGEIKIRGGNPGEGKVLTSDIDGLARWETPSGGGSSLWSESGSNIHYNDGYVGIGLNNPVSLLHLHDYGNLIAIRLTSDQSGTSINDGLILGHQYYGDGSSQSFGMVICRTVKIHDLV